MGFEVREPARPYATAGLVIDNSVAMRWLFASEKRVDQNYAISVRDHIRVQGLRVLVPYLWVYEAANVVAHYVSKGEFDPGDARNALRALHDMCSIAINRQETPLALFEAANSLGLSAYDCAYLLLARTEALPIATLDKKMRKAAATWGVEVFSA